MHCVPRSCGRLTIVPAAPQPAGRYVSMGSAVRFAADGWKARVGEDFTEENVARVAAAAAKWFARTRIGSKICVGFDMRPGAEDAALLAGAVLSSCGFAAEVSQACCPLPAVSWAVAHDDEACGGVMVTGSHRSSEYLGMALVDSDGSPAGLECYKKLDAYLKPDAPEGRGSVRRVDMCTAYEDALLAFVGPQAHRERVRVLCDPLFGAAQGVLPRILQRMGVEAYEIHRGAYNVGEEVRPDPVEPWLDDCEQAVVDSAAWAGLACDGDGDRSGVVDEHGRAIAPQKVAALLLGYLVEHRGMSGRVVVPSTASMVVRKTAELLGCPVSVAPVGFHRMYREMAGGKVLMAIEEGGALTIPQHMYARDALLAHVMLADLMGERGLRVGELIEELENVVGPWVFGGRDIRIDNGQREMLRMMGPGLNPRTFAGRAPVEVSHLDGLRVAFEDGSWASIRLSHAKPLVRVRAEAANQEDLAELVAAGAALALSPSS